MTARIFIKVGGIEVEFEGSEDFIKSELLRVTEIISDLERYSSDLRGHDSVGESSVSDDTSGNIINMTTNTIATKLDVRSGSELVLAACARLSLVKGMKNFKRSDILEEMKGATNFYKESYSKNLTKALQTLIKSGKLLEASRGIYALNAKTVKELEAKLSVM